LPILMGGGGVEFELEKGDGVALGAGADSGAGAGIGAVDGEDGGVGGPPGDDRAGAGVPDDGAEYTAGPPPGIAGPTPIVGIMLYPPGASIGPEAQLPAAQGMGKLSHVSH
jgi:hypothetical protein